MARNAVTTITWECDRCGAEVLRDDAPGMWREITTPVGPCMAVGARLLLCPACVDEFKAFMLAKEGE